MKTFAAVLSLALLAAGCSGTSSSGDLDLSEIYATYTIASEAGKAPVASAQLQYETMDGELVPLSGGDVVTCEGARLVRDESSSAPLYSAVLPSEKAAYTFIFRRPGLVPFVRQADAPPPLRITTPAPSGSYDDQFDVRWTSSDDVEGAIAIEARSTDRGCAPLIRLTHDVADDGRYAFDGSAFRPADRSAPACTYTLRVMRDVVSAVGAPFAGGVVVSRSVDTTTLTFNSN